jgi:hypothetical protein
MVGVGVSRGGAGFLDPHPQTASITNATTHTIRTSTGFHARSSPRTDPKVEFVLHPDGSERCCNEAQEAVACQSA